MIEDELEAIRDEFISEGATDMEWYIYEEINFIDVLILVKGRLFGSGMFIDEDTTSVIFANYIASIKQAVGDLEEKIPPSKMIFTREEGVEVTIERTNNKRNIIKQ